MVGGNCGYGDLRASDLGFHETILSSSEILLWKSSLKILKGV